MDSRFNDLHSVMNDTLNERRLYEEMSQTMKARGSVPMT